MFLIADHNYQFAACHVQMQLLRFVCNRVKTLKTARLLTKYPFKYHVEVVIYKSHWKEDASN